LLPSVCAVRWGKTSALRNHDMPQRETSHNRFARFGYADTL
jgi:hypothetical protein